MKNITKTVTLREYELRVYSHINDELQTTTIIKSGEKPAIEKKLDREHEVLRVLKSSEPVTKKFTMDIKKFEEIANTSDSYKFGFINRKIGGEIAVCKVYDLELDEVKTVNVENEKSLKKLEKSLLDDNYKLIKVESVETVNELYYYMSEEMFVANSNEGLPEFEMNEVL